MTAQTLGILQMVSFISQIVYWIGMVVFVGYGVAQFKRWVNFQLGVGRSGQLRQTPSNSVSVDEFVE